MKKFDYKKYIAENKFKVGDVKSKNFENSTNVTAVTDKVINEGVAQSFVSSETRRVNKGGGNSENLNQYGLPDVANHIDIYSRGTDMIYTSKTIKLFKQFVESMSNDEIKNNQPNP